MIKPQQEQTGDSVYCASAWAIEAATVAFCRREGFIVPVGALSDALIAAHHPDLGLDRSVCLRDVVEALRAAADGRASEVRSPLHAARFIEQEFGGADHG